MSNGETAHVAPENRLTEGAQNDYRPPPIRQKPKPLLNLRGPLIHKQRYLRSPVEMLEQIRRWSTGQRKPYAHGVQIRPQASLKLFDLSLRASKPAKNQFWP